MAETLDTLSMKIDALSVHIDERFAQVDERFAQVNERFAQVNERFTQGDQRLDEVKAQLGVKIEAVDSTVHLILERMDDFLKRDVANSAAHARMDTRIDAHELRITALERGERHTG